MTMFADRSSRATAGAPTLTGTGTGAGTVPQRRLARRLVFAAGLAVACQVDSTPPDTPQPDMKDPGGMTARCQYEPAPLPNGNVGKPIEKGAVKAGVGEAPLDLPVGTPLGGYSARLRLLGGMAPDNRQSPHARAFAPSAGVQTRPQVRALYLQAGGEPVLLLKADLCLSYDRLVFDVEKALAAEGLLPMRGRVVVAASHTHAGPGTYHGALHLGLGLDLFEEGQYQRLLASLVAAGRAAIRGAVPARLGAGVWDGWDKSDDIYHDRRDEDDGFPGPDGNPIGKHKEQRLLVLRVDDMAGKPLALLHSFPIHGTIAGKDNPLISVEASGHIELALEDRLPPGTLVMHLQGPAGDASPGGRGGIAHCDDKKALCENFARMESVGELAAPRILALYGNIRTSDEAALEMVTRSVKNGRDITVRDGLAYAPYDPDREVDTSPAAIYTPDGKVRNPITQFNVAAGAGLCGSKSASLPVEGIPGAKGAPYGSCADIGAALSFISQVARVPLPPEGAPTCETTRATLSAIRLEGIPVRRLDSGGNPVGGPSDDKLLLVTLPGEPVSLLADALRARSPAGPDNTFVVGYAQGHVGYILGVENWLAGGYEPSINLFGPIEGEWLMERSLDLAKLAMTPERDDAEAAGPGSPGASARFDRLVYRVTPSEPVTRSGNDMAGRVPASVPSPLLLRVKSAPASAQPSATVTRVTGRATFVFYGGDPEDDLPEVTLERETSPGTFTKVVAPSGRTLGSRGRDILLTYTPVPVDAATGKAAAHAWAAEWQAVGWDRSQGLLGTLSAPLSRYRFAVKGRAGKTGYEILSNPFQLVADGAVTVSAGYTGPDKKTVTGAAVYAVSDGYRLLRLDGPSDGDVPLSGMVTLQIRSKKTGATASKPVLLTDGKFSIDIGGLDTSMGITVRVDDAASNSGQFDVP